MTSLSESCMAETLSDLNMFYIRQIGSSLKKHVGLQDQLEKEIKIRSGALRLVGACTHEIQLLEVAKTLHASNIRSFSYMSKLQQLKEDEMVKHAMDQETGDESRICEGRVAVSDIRLPLIWKETNPSGKNKDHNRHAVFCLVSLDSEVQETTMVFVDRSTMDISFPDNLVFENATYDFKMNIRIFAYPVASKSVSGKNSQKLLSRFNRHGSKSEGKKIREHLSSHSLSDNNPRSHMIHLCDEEFVVWFHRSCSVRNRTLKVVSHSVILQKENADKGFRCTPLFDEVGSLTLSLVDVADAVKSHDLNRTNQHQFCLPVYENISCRLVAQPGCITDVMASGHMSKLDTSGSSTSWTRFWCEMKGGYLRGWSDVTRQEVKFSIDLLPSDVKITEIETFRQLRSNSFRISDKQGRHIFAAKDNEKMIEWIRNVRKHKNELEAWGERCMADSNLRTPLYIRPWAPQRHLPEYVFDSGLQSTLLYHRLGAGQRRNSQEGSHLDQGSNTCLSDAASSFSDRSATSSTDMTDCAYLEVAGSCGSNEAGIGSLPRRFSLDDKLSSLCINGGLESSESNETTTKQRFRTFASGKKKKRAPPCPQVTSTPSRESYKKQQKRPPLPKLPPPKQKLRLRKMESSSSGSSLDGILEEKVEEKFIDIPKPKPRINTSTEHLHHGERRRKSHPSEHSSHESLQTHRSSQSSGYRSGVDSSIENKLKEEVWLKRQQFIDSSSKDESREQLKKQQLHGFERTQSLGADQLLQFSRSSNDSGSFNSLVSSSGDKMYDEPSPECRPRTNTMPQASPKVLLRAAQINKARFQKPVPTPRKPRYLHQMSSKSLDESEHIYDVPVDDKRNKKTCYRLETRLSSSKHSRENPIYAKIMKEKPMT